MGGGKKQVEQEIKTCFSEADWMLLKKTLEASGKSMGQEEQVNFYYDTPDKTWLKQGQMVRLRKTDSATVLTLKSSASLNAGLLKCIEAEWRFPASNASGQDLLRSLQTHKDWPDTLPPGLECLGSMLNDRWTLNWRGFRVELDRTQIGEKLDYELECETQNPEEFLMEFKPFLERLSIPYRPQTETKFKRFFSNLQNRK